MMIKTDENKLEILHVLMMQFKVFFTLKWPTPMSQLKDDEMKKLILTTGQMRMIASKNTKIVSQFLEIVA